MWAVHLRFSQDGLRAAEPAKGGENARVHECVHVRSREQRGGALCLCGVCGLCAVCAVHAPGCGYDMRVVWVQVNAVCVQCVCVCVLCVWLSVDVCVVCMCAVGVEMSGKVRDMRVHLCGMCAGLWVSCVCMCVSICRVCACVCDMCVCMHACGCL